MNTTIIRTTSELKKEILNFAQSLSSPKRPVIAFGWEEDSMVVAGCSTQCLVPLLEKYNTEMEVIRMSQN